MVFLLVDLKLKRLLLERTINSDVRLLTAFVGLDLSSNQLEK
jgi:uncharacterized protein YqfA (UPF0365 family)